MIESNINITSNVYIRSNSDIPKDREYTKRITGVKRLTEIRERYTGFENVPLSYTQQQLMSGNQTCSYAKSGEVSFGPVMVNGKLEWVNRCEYTKCKGFGGCNPQNIQRMPMPVEHSEDTESLQKFMEELGIVKKDDIISVKTDRNTSKIEEEPKKFAAPRENSPEEIKESISQYIEITEPSCIINAPLETHIILNSGPGTGKTYTIIQRLIYTLKNDLCPAEEIYILCYTRSAKKVIETKLEQAIADDIIPPAAKNICILTFDSYATYFLMAMKEQGVIKENFDNYDYNERIKLFNKYISEEDFENISYFVVDEIQDLVNERAEMVLKILSKLKCGYLLAGDRCQSIYDYEADKDATIDSVEFYKRAEALFPKDIRRYEITVNRRQAAELAKEASKMREVLLNDSNSKQNEYAKNLSLKYLGKTRIETYIKMMDHAPTVSTAILCRNNGEAEYISSLLCKRGIPHNLNRGVNNTASLPRWIADVFWDHCFENISKSDFMEKFNFRCSCDIDPEILWKHFCKLTNTKDDTIINVSKMTTALTVSNNIPNDFYDKPPMLTVSTIHKAKGSEFDKVILIKSAFDTSSKSAEEARIQYVALTRPKMQFETMGKTTRYFMRTMSGRVIETGFHNIYKKINRYCKCIAVGLTGDIDVASFVSGDFDSTLDLQQYIIENIKLYDKLSAERSQITGLYEIYHNERCIGTLSNEMTAEIDTGIRSTDYKYRLPKRLENIYVSGITTEILKQFNANVVPIEYQKSKICFGIQITGLAELKFEKK